MRYVCMIFLILIVFDFAVIWRSCVKKVYRIFDFFQVLYAKDLDQRSITFEKAIAMGEEYQMKSKVLYICLIHWFSVDDISCFFLWRSATDKKQKVYKIIRCKTVWIINSHTTWQVTCRQENLNMSLGLRHNKSFYYHGQCIEIWVVLCHLYVVGSGVASGCR